MWNLVIEEEITETDYKAIAVIEQYKGRLAELCKDLEGMYLEKLDEHILSGHEEVTCTVKTLFYRVKKLYHRIKSYQGFQDAKINKTRQTLENKWFL